VTAARNSSIAAASVPQFCDLS